MERGMTNTWPCPDRPASRWKTMNLVFSVVDNTRALHYRSYLGHVLSHVVRLFWPKIRGHIYQGGHIILAKYGKHLLFKELLIFIHHRLSSEICSSWVGLNAATHDRPSSLFPATAANDHTSIKNLPHFITFNYTHWKPDVFKNASMHSEISNAVKFHISFCTIWIASFRTNP